MYYSIVYKDKYYEPATYILDQIAKENSLGRVESHSESSFESISINSQQTNQSIIDDVLGLVEQLAQFIELRHQMMKLQVLNTFLLIN